VQKIYTDYLLNSSEPVIIIAVFLSWTTSDFYRPLPSLAFKIYRYQYQYAIHNQYWSIAVATATSRRHPHHNRHDHHLRHSGSSIKPHRMTRSRLDFELRWSRHSISKYALISSQLDYANSVLYGLPTRNISHLRRVQNVATRVITQKPLHVSSVDTLLTELHWLPFQ